MRISQTPTLFAEFLHRLNQAIQQKRTTAAVETFVGAARNAADASGIFDVAVYAHTPDKPVDHFTVQYRDGRFELVTRGQSGSGNTVELPICQLDELVNPGQ